MVLSIHWLLENGNTGEEQFLWDVAELAHQQVLYMYSYCTSNLTCDILLYLSVVVLCFRVLTGRATLQEMTFQPVQHSHSIWQIMV